MPPAHKQFYRVADVEVDLSRGCLRRGGAEQPLREQSFQVLRYLIEHRERRVTKEELIEQVWRGAAVTDDALVQCITDIRRALGDDYRRPRFIKTIPKVGYRFIPEIKEEPPRVVATIETEEITSLEIELMEDADGADEPGVRELTVRPRLPAASAPRRRLLVAGALVLTAAATLALAFDLRREQDGPRLAEVALPQAPGQRALAVMYFENQSGDAELDWLREGLADMFITNLSRRKGLAVLNRRQLHLLLERAGHRPGGAVRLKTAFDVARRSRAELALLGSFARFGERLRIDVQLYDARGSRHLFSESLDVERIERLPAQVDLFTLKLAAHLGAAPDVRERPPALSEVTTDNLEAYRCYSLAMDKAFALHSAEAIALLERAVTLDPQFAIAHARIGYVYAVLWNHPAEAKPHLERAFRLSARLTEKDRRLIGAWYALANLDFPGAVLAFRDVVANDPLDVEAYWRLGRLLVGENRFEEAVEVYQQGLAVDAEAKEIYNSLGGLYSALGRHDEAITMHQRYAQLAPDEPNAHDSLGLSFQWAGRYSEALEAYNRALALKPDFEIALIHLANTYAQTGRYREALRLYEKYIQIAPSDSERARGYRSLATLYAMRGDLARAEQAARKELSFDQERYFGSSLVVALARGDAQSAERLLRQYTAVTFPERGGRGTPRFNHYFSGQLALLEGRDQEALDNFHALLRGLPHAWHIDTYEDSLANAYLKLGRLDEAINEYERVLRLNPNYPLAHYHLAQAHERKGQAGQARSLYEQFLRVWKGADPDLPEVVAARRALQG